MKRRIAYRDGHCLVYTDAGSQCGYPVLVQHGLIASIDDCELFDRLIRCRTRVISIARPGYGESSPYVMRSFAEWADIVAVLVDDLQLPQFDILGMSSGAPYGYAIGARLADRVRNIFIFSGIPALCDLEVLAAWPHEPLQDAGMPQVQQLARRLFFSGLSEEDLARNDVMDSMANDCFGPAQDLRLRFLDWRFSLSDIRADVYMRHSRTDDSVPFETALATARLLPRCIFEDVEDGPHFSPEALDEFVQKTMAAHYL